MAIDLEDGVKAETELENLITSEKEEAKKTEDEINKNIPSVDLGDEFKFYINFFHKIVYNNVFKIGLDETIIAELDSNLIKIIEKRFPNIATILEKFGPELAYAGTLATGFMIAQANKPQEQLPDQPQTENTENVKQEVSN